MLGCLRGTTIGRPPPQRNMNYKKTDVQCTPLQKILLEPRCGYKQKQTVGQTQVCVCNEAILPRQTEMQNAKCKIEEHLIRRLRRHLPQRGRLIKPLPIPFYLLLLTCKRTLALALQGMRMTPKGREKSRPFLLLRREQGFS